MVDYAGTKDYEQDTAARLFDPLTWQKSSASEPNGGNCVEVNLGRNLVGIRDTKLRESPVFVLGTGEWSAFVTAVKAGRFDLPR